VIRVLLRCLLAVAVIAVAALMGWRVLAPAEVLATAKTPYPEIPRDAPGVTGQLSLAPLIVDRRMRVYAAERQIRADSPVDGKTVYTPRWSLRRWPQQLSGVVAVGSTVVSRWSDGQLIAIDARTGQIAWRADGPAGPPYEGHRNGSATLWSPPGLHVERETVVVSSGGSLAAYEVATGARRWAVTVPHGCGDGFTTAGGQYVCATGAYDVATGAAVSSWPAGPFTALGCRTAGSDCAALRDGSAHGWVTDGPAARRLADLDRPGSTIAAGVVFYPDGDLLRSVTPAHDYPAGRVLGVSDGHVVILRTTNVLSEIDPRTGVPTAEMVVRLLATQQTDFALGGYQVTDGYAAIERLREKRPADPDKPDYYFANDAVIVAAL
jgi:outer membrane protein assembly factor BamB